MPVKIAISIGDINGIGPEVVLKSLSQIDLTDCTPLILSNRKVVDFYSELLNLQLPVHVIGSPEDAEPRRINIMDCYQGEQIIIEPGTFSGITGKLAMMAVELGIELCMSDNCDALVTAPISKEAINKAGYHVPGHTEFLAEKTGVEDNMMMLVNKGLRVGLVSIHEPLKKVPALITQASVYKHIKIMHRTLNRDFNIENPHIAVLGLNPHAGDGGIIGTEEIEIIGPSIQKAQTEQINATGPHPADGFFGNRKYEHCDGILAMYHDQGLIPFKTLSFGAGVNFTAGLPMIRTSPDHGTAFDIAGTKQADPSSFTAAFNLAVELSQNRKAQNK